MGAQLKNTMKNTQPKNTPFIYETCSSYGNNHIVNIYKSADRILDIIITIWMEFNLNKLIYW
jgi:hypothetical protein